MSQICGCDRTDEEHQAGDDGRCEYAIREAELFQREQAPRVFPPVTIVLGTEHRLGEHEGLMRAVYCAEHQNYPSELLDISICFTEGGTSLEDVRIWGVFNAKTEWVAVMADDDDWPQDQISKWADVAARYPFASTAQVPGSGQMFKREYWLLTNAAHMIPTWGKR